MPSKKLIVMSLAVEPELHDLLKAHAKKKNLSVSKFIRKWLDMYPFNSNNVIPVVLDIPENLVKNKVDLSNFMTKKSQMLVSLLCS